MCSLLPYAMSVSREELGKLVDDIRQNIYVEGSPIKNAEMMKTLKYSV